MNIPRGAHAGRGTLPGSLAFGIVGHRGIKRNSGHDQSPLSGRNRTEESQFQTHSIIPNPLERCMTKSHSSFRLAGLNPRTRTHWPSAAPGPTRARGSSRRDVRPGTHGPSRRLRRSGCGRRSVGRVAPTLASVSRVRGDFGPAEDRAGGVDRERVVHEEEGLGRDGRLVAARAGCVRVGEVERAVEARQVEAIDEAVEGRGGWRRFRSGSGIGGPPMRPSSRPETASIASRVASKSSRRRFIRQ